MCCEPFSYAQMQWVLANSYFIITDSGGLQEEASVYRKPVLVVRNTTERPEAVAAGVSLLVGCDHRNRHNRQSGRSSKEGAGGQEGGQGLWAPESNLRWAMRELLAGGRLYQRMSRAVFPFGKGNSSHVILAALRSLFADSPHGVPSSSGSGVAGGVARFVTQFGALRALPLEALVADDMLSLSDEEDSNSRKIG